MCPIFQRCQQVIFNVVVGFIIFGAISSVTVGGTTAINTPSSNHGVTWLLMLIPDVGFRTTKYSQSRWTHASVPNESAADSEHEEDEHQDKQQQQQDKTTEVENKEFERNVTMRNCRLFHTGMVDNLSGTALGKFSASGDHTNTQRLVINGKDS